MTDSADQTPMLTARRHVPSLLVFLLTAFMLLGADLWSKAVAFEHVAGQPVVLTRDHQGELHPIPAHEPIIVVPSVLALQLTANEGAVFGLGQGKRWLFIAFSVVAVLVITVIFARSAARSYGMHIALAAVLAGALGNFYDRLLYGAVRDLLHLFPGVKLPFGWSWPDGSEELYPWIFNIADVSLICGAILLAIVIYRHDRAEARRSREQDDQSTTNSS